MGPICHYVPYAHIHDTHLKVKEVYYNNTWSFEILHTNLPEKDQKQIRATPAAHQADIGNAIVWVNESNQVFSAKAGYKWLQQHHQAMVPTSQTP